MAFATAEDIERLLNRQLSVGEAAQIESLIEQATAAIKGWTRQNLEAVADDSVFLAGTWAPDLVLPERPVTAVTSVTVNGVALDAAAWEWNQREVLRRGAGPRAFDLPVGALIVDSLGLDYQLQQSGAWNWNGPQATVEVTYSHGYDPLPSDISGVCKAMVARSFVNPTGLVEESIGSYRVVYDQEARARAAGMALIADDLILLRRYRRWWA